MMKKILLTFLTILTVCAIAYSQQPQTKEEVKRKQDQLNKEIADLSKSLNSIQNDKGKVLALNNMIQKKIRAREELIGTINKDIHRLDDDIYYNEIEIYRLKKELDTLKNQYAQSIVFAYKNRSNYNYLNFLFSASNFNDALKRVAYLKSYRQFRETQASSIIKTQEVLQQKVASLGVNKNERGLTLSEQSKQLQSLEQDKKEKINALNKLKVQEKDIAKQIQTRERQRTKLQQTMIAIVKREIAAAEADRKKKEQDEKNRIAAANAKNNTKPATNNPVVSGTKPKPTEAKEGLANTKKTDRTYSSFEITTAGREESIKFERKGLPWPVDGGYVSVPFGSYRIPDTKIMGDSKGIEISMDNAASVKSVADGEVSAVGEMVAGEGVTIFIRHGKYFTSYSHLSSANVSKGQQVKAGTVLGKTGAADGGGYIVFFSVMNDKFNMLNPENFLKRR